MSNKKSNIRIGTILNIIIFIGGVSFLLFNDYGIIKYLNLNSRLSEVNNELQSKKEELTKLENEIDLLKNNMIKIEKVAREKYYMKADGEMVLEIEEFDE